MVQNNPFHASFYCFKKKKKIKLKGTETSVVQETKTRNQLTVFINTEQINKLKTKELDKSVMTLCITVHWESLQHCSTTTKMVYSTHGTKMF